MSIAIVEVKKGQNENAPSLIRRFQKRVQESGLLPRVRGTRYAKRSLSKLKVKRAKLLKLGRQKKYETLKRLGKLTVVDRKFRGRR